MSDHDSAPASKLDPMLVTTSYPTYPSHPPTEISHRNHPKPLSIIIGFVLGVFAGGLISNLLINLFIGLFSSALNRNLILTGEATLVKLGFLVVGLVIGGMIGSISVIQGSPQSQILTLEQEALSRFREEEKISHHFAHSIKYIAFILIDTIRVIVPSPSTITRRGNIRMDYGARTYREILDSENITLDTLKRDIIIKNWLPQIEWTNARASHARDMNEIISWWQIIFAALIPFIASFEDIGGIRGVVIVSILGIFVTILTGILQFRRPEERWRQYRILAEGYERELWNYISLTGHYGDRTHEEAFNDFNKAMMSLREEHVRNFFRETTNNPTSQNTPSALQATQSKSSVNTLGPVENATSDKDIIPISDMAPLSPDNG